MSDTIVHVFPDTARLGRAIARAAQLPYATLRLHAFPDGESVVRARHRDGAEAIVVRRLDHPNAKVFEVLLAADALRGAGARRVTLVAPYLPYMRQDRRFNAGEPISQRVLGALLGRAFDRVLTVEAHLHRIARLSQAVPEARARSLSAAPVLASWLKWRTVKTVLVGPDAESEPWVTALARRVGVPCMIGNKERAGDRRVALRLPAKPVGYTRAVLVDDIVSSGATLAAAARALRRQGFVTVDALAVHALISPLAAARLRRAGIRHLWSCDTVLHSSNAISVAPLIAAAL